VGGRDRHRARLHNRGLPARQAARSDVRRAVARGRGGPPAQRGMRPGVAEEAPHPPIPTFVHHRSRLTEGQQHAWERWWPERGRDVADILSGAEPYDPPAWFGRTA